MTGCWNCRPEAGGLALVVAERKELTIINLVGHIDLKQLSSLGGLAGIPAAVLGAASAVQGSPSSTGKAPASKPARDKQK